jgi:hypothetical protein
MMRRQKARNNPIKLGGKVDRNLAMEMIPGMIAYEVKEISIPSEKGHAKMIQGDRSEKASKILEIITHAI